MTALRSRRGARKTAPAVTPHATRPHASPVATLAEARAFIGGGRPIHPSTYWRGVRAGIYPAPVSIGPGVKRVPWSALYALMAHRGVDIPSSGHPAA